MSPNTIIVLPWVSNLIGKELSCHESRCRIESDLTRIVEILNLCVIEKTVLMLYKLYKYTHTLI